MALVQFLTILSVKDINHKDVNISYFDKPISRSIVLHLLLSMMVVMYLMMAPKTRDQDSPLTVQLIEPKFKNKSNAILSNKNRVFKEQKSSKEFGSGGLPKSKTTVRVSDLGVKINTDQKAPTENESNWTSHVLGEATKGGDYVRGLRENETSELNTQESIFFSYFGRMYNQLYGAWAPIIRKQIEQQSAAGRKFSIEDSFITRAMVTLSGKGEILKVQLLQESGNLELDQAAVIALNKAGPYPNPPKGMIDKNGNAQLPVRFIIRN